MDHLAAKLHRRSEPASLDDAGLRLEQAEYLVRREHRLAVQHPLLGLLDALPHQGQETVELREQAVGRPISWLGSARRWRLRLDFPSDG